MKTYIAEHEALLSVKVTGKEKRELQREAERQGVTLSHLIRDRLGLHQPVPPLPKWLSR